MWRVYRSVARVMIEDGRYLGRRSACSTLEDTPESESSGARRRIGPQPRVAAPGGRRVTLKLVFGCVMRAQRAK